MQYEHQQQQHQQIITATTPIRVTHTLYDNKMQQQQNGVPGCLPASI